VIYPGANRHGPRLSPRHGGARGQALLDLKNLDTLKANLEYTVETYPITLLGDNVPMHYALAGGPYDPR